MCLDSVLKANFCKLYMSWKVFYSKSVYVHVMDLNVFHFMSAELAIDMRHKQTTDRLPDFQQACQSTQGGLLNILVGLEQDNKV